MADCWRQDSDGSLSVVARCCEASDSFAFVAMKRKKPIIDIDEGGEINAHEVNSLMYSVIEDFAYALNHQSKPFRESPSLLTSLLRVFITTHKSMLLLMDVRVTDPLMAADAVSLVREQVEKIYVISLLVHDSRKWTKQYLRNSWKAMYEDRLLMEIEHGHNPRFHHYIYEHTPKVLEKMRYVPKSSGKGFELLVSKKMERSVKYRFNNPYTKKAQWPDYFSGEEFSQYFLFPTPGKSIGHIDDVLTKKFLGRWYKEYQWLCRYSHIALDKVFLEGMSHFKDYYTASEVDRQRTRHMERAAMLSYMAAASACAEVSKILRENYGAVAQLREIWEILHKTSLLANQLWNMYVKEVIS